MDQIKARLYITEKITQNKLPINTDECLNAIVEYANIYDEHCYKILFYRYIHNLAGEIASKYSHELEELLGWLEVHKHKIMEVVYFYMPDSADYARWKVYRKDLYNSLTNADDIRILNYVEMSTINFITDISNTNYILSNGVETIKLSQIGYNIEYNGERASFIHVLGKYFKLGYTYKII